MPEHIQYQDDDLFNPETHHEESDVPIRPLFWAIFLFIIFAILTHVVLFGMYKAFVKSERKRMDPPQTQVARPIDADVPKNQPLLQPFPRPDANRHPLAPNQDTPVTDLVEMRTSEDQALHTYGWVDRGKGVVHIPIEAAKEKLLGVVHASGVPPVPQGAPEARTTPGGTQ